MAALRGGISTVIIPHENEKDLEEIDQTVRKALKFVRVKQVDEVLVQVLAGGLPTPAAETARQAPEAPKTAGHAVNLRQ